MTDELRSIRALARESLRGVEPATVGKKRPKFEEVDPRTLFVEAAYQREVGENGVRLIRRIYAGFNWARFKPPICVRLPESGNVLVCIDGQHTAIAAASHPDIEKIPIMVVDAADVGSRASAFVGQNRERVGLTQMAVYKAEIAAGDPIAAVMARALHAAGAEILGKSVNLRRPTGIGKTIAVGTIRMIARKQGEEFLTRVLRVLVGAARGPIKADELAAVALAIEGTGPKLDGALEDVIAAKKAEAWAAEASVAAAASGEALPSTLAALWLRKLGRTPQSAPAKPAGGKGGSAVHLMEVMKAAPKPPPPPPQARKPVPTAAPALPVPAPAPKPREPAPAAAPAAVPKPDPARIVERNGIVIDLATREIVHRGIKIRIDRDDGVRLVAFLARVMPALLDEGRVVKATFGSNPPDGGERLRGLIKVIGPGLAAARLEVKTLAKIGVRLNDLGPE